jgi:hypothetical protein
MMQSWFKSSAVCAIATAPIAGYLIFNALSDLASVDYVNRVQPAASYFSKLEWRANDLFFDIKVQAGVVPDPALTATSKL